MRRRNARDRVCVRKFRHVAPSVHAGSLSSVAAYPCQAFMARHTAAGLSQTLGRAVRLLSEAIYFGYRPTKTMDLATLRFGGGNARGRTAGA